MIQRGDGVQPQPPLLQQYLRGAEAFCSSAAKRLAHHAAACTHAAGAAWRWRESLSVLMLTDDAAGDTAAIAVLGADSVRCT
jgi:hypothetical protein